MMSFDDIWNYLSQDTEDENQISLINNIALHMGEGNYEKPFYSASVTIFEEQQKIDADLIWPASKVMLFLKENSDSYELSKSTNWTAVCLDDTFDIPSFIQKITR